MRFESLELQGSSDDPLRRLDARVKLLATLAYVLTVIATPVGWWRALSAEGLVLAFLVGFSGVSPRELSRRWLGFLVLFGFLTLMVAPARPERAEYGLAVVALTILAKNSLAFLATLLLVRVTPFQRLLAGLRGLGVPATFTATIGFMYRYIFVFMEELDRMVLARRARTFRRTGKLDWGLLSGLIGVLFVRSFERGERAQAAMLARGWDGVPRSLD